MIRDSIEADGVLAIRDSPQPQDKILLFVGLISVTHLLRSRTQDEQDEACARQGSPMPSGCAWLWLPLVALLLLGAAERCAKVQAVPACPSRLQFRRISGGAVVAGRLASITARSKSRGSTPYGVKIELPTGFHLAASKARPRSTPSPVVEGPNLYWQNLTAGKTYHFRVRFFVDNCPGRGSPVSLTGATFALDDTGNPICVTVATSAQVRAAKERPVRTGKRGEVGRGGGEEELNILSHIL